MEYVIEVEMFGGYAELPFSFSSPAAAAAASAKLDRHAHLLLPWIDACCADLGIDRAGQLLTKEVK